MRYDATFTNLTPHTWTFALFQTPAGADDRIDSVSWQQVRVAPLHGSGWVEWNDGLIAAIVTYRDVGNGLYSTFQRLPTPSDAQWDVVEKDGAKQLVRRADGARDRIRFTNRSGTFAGVGIGQSGALALAARTLYDGTSLQFSLPVTCWASMFHALQPGEIVAGNELVDPLRVDVARGTSLEFVASVDGATLSFSQTGGAGVTASYAAIVRTLRG